MPIALAAVAPVKPVGAMSQPDNATHSLDSLSLTNKQLNLNSPVDLGLTYSDLTGTYFNAQYVLPLGERFAFAALGEYGGEQYRLNGTLGYNFSPMSQIKATAERLGQRLPFQFDSGAINARVHQDAYGAQFQRLLPNRFVNAVNAGGYWAEAANKNLNLVLFTSNGLNCAGFTAGIECINYRYLAGATSKGLDAGLSALLSASTEARGTVYYDEVRYNSWYGTASQQDRSGLGFGIKVQQFLNERFKVQAEATVREIYDTYQAVLLLTHQHYKLYPLVKQ